MTAQAFRPRGEIPEWRMIYDALLATADFGDVITYAQLDEVLGREFVGNRSPIYAARRHLGEMRSRWLVPVPRTGYRVPEANEHIDVAQGHKRKGKRQLGLMQRVAEVTDLSRLTETELARFDSQARINAALYMVLVHHEKRIARIEAVLRTQGVL